MLIIQSRQPFEPRQQSCDCYVNHSHDLSADRNVTGILVRFIPFGATDLVSGQVVVELSLAEAQSLAERLLRFAGRDVRTDSVAQGSDK